MNILDLSRKQSVQENRDKILRLESTMLNMEEHNVLIETKHSFSPGLYIREIFVPKGTFLTGKIQKTEYMNIFSKGEISVMTENGLKRVSAPCMIRSKPGLKRAGFAHEDSLWITVHANPNNEKNIDVLENLLFAESFDGLPELMDTTDEPPIITFQGKKPNYEKTYLESKRTIEDVLVALNHTPEKMRIESENLSDQIPFPCPIDSIAVLDSPIHGKGLFATRLIKKWEVIAPARIGSKRTPAGRFCNHSGKPNSEIRTFEKDCVFIIAIQDIDPGSEILNDYYLNYVNSRTQGEKILCQA